MKYIRTIDNAITHKEIIEKVNSITAFRKLYPYIKIVKSADTIEELCDEFVQYIPDMYNTPYLNEWRNIQSTLGNILANDGVVYGAIWTDKGLIYVAKMNDKGELELL